MDNVIIFAIAAITIVLIFDYTNGFHDAANIIAPMIASRAMTPVQAVILVASFEFLGPLLGGTAVANTIGKFINLNEVSTVLSVAVVMCGVFGAIFWNILTWWYGIPSSSSHALVGGLVGAVIAAVGSAAVVWGFGELFTTGKMTGVTKVLLSLIISPLLGFWVGFLIMRLLSMLLANAKPSANKPLRKVQFITAGALAFSHGANDAQKSMGIITLVLVLGNFIPTFEVPFWVILSCATVITLGILSGGWRIVKTVGFAIFKIRPIHAVSAQLTSAARNFWGLRAGRAGIHYPCGQLFDHGYWLLGTPQGGALVKGPGHRQHLDYHHSGFGIGGSPDLLRHRFLVGVCRMMTPESLAR